MIQALNLYMTWALAGDWWPNSTIDNPNRVSISQLDVWGLVSAAAFNVLYSACPIGAIQFVGPTGYYIGLSQYAERSQKDGAY